MTFFVGMCVLRCLTLNVDTQTLYINKQYSLMTILCVCECIPNKDNGIFKNARNNVDLNYIRTYFPLSPQTPHR